jgi:hypothetical protein
MARTHQDYEDGSLEDEAEESAAEETAEFPEQPGAIDIVSLDCDRGGVNSSDEALSGIGNNTIGRDGTDFNKLAQLPGRGAVEAYNGIPGTSDTLVESKR